MKVLKDLDIVEEKVEKKGKTRLIKTQLTSKGEEIASIVEMLTSKFYESKNSV